MPPAYLRAPAPQPDAPLPDPLAVGCGGKVMHATQHVAGRSAARVGGTAYLCRHCGSYHVSRQRIGSRRGALDAGMHVR